ncbi:MAG: ABC transporter ATP-binding protein [Candidatus Bipolaricaulota bacterium]|nr:ABC transporter ATP-binding protein [Candidatus Bipolaricaulota bacterium]
MPLLTVKQVTSGYGDMEVLHDVSIAVDPQEIVTIIGPNGAGKSTLMKTIFGLLKPTTGAIRFTDHEIGGLSPDRIVRLGMAYVPQVENVFPSLTVHENLEMGAFIRSDDFSDRIDDMFALFPILGKRGRQQVGKMSGGERQMVAMARALMLNPQLILLDEPSAALAPNLAEVIFERIIAVNETGVAILIVEQNAKESLKLSHRGYVLASGRNRFTDTGENLLANDEIGQLYLGG